MRDLQFDIKARDKTAAAFDSARANARGFNHALDLTARGFNLAATAAKGFAVGFAVSSLAEFGSVVRGMVSDAADLVDMADKVGVSTENIQRMVYGFGQAGVAAEDIDKILTQWAKRIGEAHTKGGQLADIFRANNVALTDSEGRLRSSVGLMRDYANLIAGAGSDQERMRLATLAFGDAGEAMVLALRDGADGMDRLMKSTDAAGGVLEDKLLRRQAEIDEAFGRMWRNFETNSKSAILSAVTWLDDLRQGFDGLMQGYDARRKASDLGALAGSLAGTPRPARGDRLPSGVDRRIDAAFAGAAPEGNEAMTRMLRDRFGPRTVVPHSNDLGDTPSRTASISAARDQESAYRRVVERLGEEREMLGHNAAGQRILSEQRRAGVSAASEQGKAIEAVVRGIEAETERLDRFEVQQREVNDAVRNLAGSALDGVLAWAQGAATWADYKSVAPQSPTSMLDQTIGTGNGLTAAFQLVKAYTSGGVTWTRTITKPVGGSVLVSVNGVARTAGAHFNLNTATGIVTFTAGNIPPNGHVVRAGFEFDVPARFDDDALSVRLLHANGGDIISIPIVEIRP